MALAQAAALIKQGRAQQFDPDIVDCFETLLPQFEDIALRWSDA